MPLVRKKHPLAIRWFHWVNFPVLAMMLWSGLWIYWANDEYNIKVGGLVVVKFFPQWFYEAFNIPFNLAVGMAWHFMFMWVFMLNGFAYVCYTLFSGEWKYLLPGKGSFKNAIKVTLHDIGLRKELPPVTKFNGAQQIAYTSIIIFGAGSVLTGLAIYKPIQLLWLTSFLGGYKTARLFHFCLALSYVFFFIIHVVQVIRAGWNNFRSMITGIEVVTMSKNTKENET
ncbi:cytochrome b/b6 domain-containing protein [Sporocytophaga myxococcoides]|uniref:cytochrome b/b6 domain-containing protein n=1 Tax=Sporocytophaga myxococcoides TaxID=153721 RepID=UPI0005EF7191|nr:cytochrome b/b6 domain-containing protein [Sporocytophaga myxococcoides]